MQKSDIEHLATKEEMAKLKTNIAKLDAKFEIAIARVGLKLEVGFAKLRAPLDTKITRPKSQAGKTVNRAIMWMVLSYIALYSALFATLVVLLGDR